MGGGPDHRFTFGLVTGVEASMSRGCEIISAFCHHQSIIRMTVLSSGFIIT